MRLRTLDGERVKGELTTEYPMSTDGSPVLVVNDEPFDPEEAEFFLESATREELRLLKEGGYELERWQEHKGSEEIMDDEFTEEEYTEDEPEDF